MIKPNRKIVYQRMAAFYSDGRPVYYSVEVDLDMLTLMAFRADKNKAKQTVAGALRVTILNAGQAEFVKD